MAYTVKIDDEEIENVDSFVEAEDIAMRQVMSSASFGADSIKVVDNDGGIVAEYRIDEPDKEFVYRMSLSDRGRIHHLLGDEFDLVRWEGRWVVADKDDDIVPYMEVVRVDGEVSLFVNGEKV